MTERKCFICGKPFAPVNGVQKYCSQECFREQQKVYNHRKYARRRAESAESRRARKAQQEHFNAKCRAANAAGLTYGQYDAQLRRAEAHDRPLIELIGGRKDEN